MAENVETVIVIKPCLLNLFMIRICFLLFTLLLIHTLNFDPCFDMSIKCFFYAFKSLFIFVSFFG